MLNGKTAKIVTIGAAFFGIGVVTGAFIIGEKATAQSNNPEREMLSAECVFRNLPKLQNVASPNAFTYMVQMCISYPRLGR